MLEANWSDPETLWLLVTNMVLGAVVLVCCLVAGFGIVQEFLERRKRRAQPGDDLDRELRDLIESYRRKEQPGTFLNR